MYNDVTYIIMHEELIRPHNYQEPVIMLAQFHP